MSGDFLFFTVTSAATFRAVAGRIVPSEPDSPGADCEAALRIADRALFERPERDRRLLTVFLKVLEYLPVLRYGRRFSRLRPEAQHAVLRFFETNRWVARLRQGFFGVKTFA